MKMNLANQMMASRGLVPQGRWLGYMMTAHMLEGDLAVSPGDPCSTNKAGVLRLMVRLHRHQQAAKPLLRGAHLCLSTAAPSLNQVCKADMSAAIPCRAQQPTFEKAGGAPSPLCLLPLKCLWAGRKRSGIIPV